MKGSIIIKYRITEDFDGNYKAEQVTFKKSRGWFFKKALVECYSETLCKSKSIKEVEKAIKERVSYEKYGLIKNVKWLDDRGEDPKPEAWF